MQDATDRNSDNNNFVIAFAFTKTSLPDMPGRTNVYVTWRRSQSTLNKTHATHLRQTSMETQATDLD